MSRFALLRLNSPTALGLALVACANPDPVATGIVDASMHSTERVFPTLEVSVDFPIEIDDLDGTGSGLHDANHCSAGSTDELICPPPISPTDNVGFPGLDPTNPGVLAPDSIDWADLDPTGPHFLADADVLGLPDDIFRSGSCIQTGNVPNKANIQRLGVAGHDPWLYLFMERATVQGQEEYHFYFTREAPEFLSTAACRDGEWIWTLQDGAVQVTVRFQSTSGLPLGTVQVDVYDDPDGIPDTGLTAEMLLASTKWAAPNPALFPSPMQPAWLAYNVAPSNQSPGHDTERGITGVQLASGQLAEVAIDIERVFGSGCGLTRSMALITTASGSGGRTDSLKDFFGPVTISTGDLTVDLQLFDSCDEDLGYEVAVNLAGEPLALPHPDVGVELAIDCGEGEILVVDDDGSSSNDEAGPGGPIPIPLSGATECVVTARTTGRGPLAQCDGEVEGGIDLHAALQAEALLAQAECGTQWQYDAVAADGLPPYGYAWTFASADAGLSPTSSNDASGEGTTSGLPTAVAIDGTLVVTDDRGCEVEAQGSTVANPAFVAQLVPLTSDSECYDGDVAFDVLLSGGGGDWTLNWGTTGDGVLDAACAAENKVSDPSGQAKLSCSLGLGDGVCASGGIDLSVSDAVCGTSYDLAVAAERTSSLVVNP